MPESKFTLNFFLICAIGILASNQFQLSSKHNKLVSELEEIKANKNQQNLNNEDFEFHKKLTQETNIRIAALENSMIDSENVISTHEKELQDIKDEKKRLVQKINDVNKIVENIIKKNILERASELSKKYKPEIKKSKKSKMNTKDRNE